MPAAKKKPVHKKPATVKTRASIASAKPEVPQLTDFERRVCEEYLGDLNQTRAYLRVSPKVTNDSARTLAARLFAKVHIKAEVARLQAERSDRTKITADRAVQLAWDTMTADARELSEIRVGCCRFCWGHNHLYQRSAGEFAHAKAEHQRLLNAAVNDKERRKVGKFEEQGGTGFDKRREPNPACPDCAGEGIPRTVFKDTSKLTPGAAALYAGVEETKDGFKVRSHSRDAAQDKVFRHLGLYNDKIQLTLPMVTVKDFSGKKGPDAQ